MPPLSQAIGPCGRAASFLLYFKRQHTSLAFSISVAVVFEWFTDALPLCAYTKGDLQSIQCKQNKDGVLNRVIADCDP